MTTTDVAQSRTGSALAYRAREGLMRYLGVIAVLALCVVWLSITQKQFLTSGNILNIFQASAALLVVSIGMTFVMISGAFDLSMGGLLALTGVMLATLIQQGLPVVVSIVLVLVGATLIGLVVNGLLIAKVGLSFFVVTLGTASIFRGIALLKTEGQTQGLYDQPIIKAIGSESVLGIPILVIIAAVVLVIGFAVLRYTGFGRQLYAVGGNQEAARMAGINVVSVRAAAFAVCGACAGIAGVMTTGRLASAAPDAGMAIELTAAAAVLLGGTSLMGGSGSLLGTLLGVLFLGVLSNGLTLVGISAFWQGVITGVVLVLAVLFDRFRPNQAR